MNLEIVVNFCHVLRVLDYEGIEYDNRGNMTWPSQVLIHEYGHYLQSRKYGFWGYSIGGINSGLHPRERTDEKAKFERDASNQGFYYFQGKGISMKGYDDVWDKQKMPIVKSAGLMINPFWFWMNKIFY